MERDHWPTWAVDSVGKPHLQIFYNEYYKAVFDEFQVQKFHTHTYNIYSYLNNVKYVFLAYSIFTLILVNHLLMSEILRLWGGGSCSSDAC